MVTPKGKCVRLSLKKKDELYKKESIAWHKQGTSLALGIWNRQRCSCDMLVRCADIDIC